MKRYIILLVCCLAVIPNVHAQFFPFLANSQGTGFVSGYSKTGTRNINFKHSMRFTCKGFYTTKYWYSSVLYPNGYADSTIFSNVDVNGNRGIWGGNLTLGQLLDQGMMINNTDSSAQVQPFLSNGRRIPNPYPPPNTPPDMIGQRGSLVNSICNSCYPSFPVPHAYDQTQNTISYVNELISDTTISFGAQLPNFFKVDTPATNGITLFHGQADILTDSIAYRLTNIVTRDRYFSSLPGRVHQR